MCKSKCFLAFLSLFLSSWIYAEIDISSIPDQQVSQGIIYTYSPALAAGSATTWYKEYGPDDVVVDPLTGHVSWAIPADLPAESFHLGVKVYNEQGEKTLETWVLTVGTQDIYYAETSDKLNIALDWLSSGDTLILKNGVRAVDPTSKTSARQDLMVSSDFVQLPPSGSASGFTTVIAEDPGQVTIDVLGVDTDGYEITNTDYFALKGFVLKNAGRHGIKLVNTNFAKIIDVGVVDSGLVGGTNTHQVANIYIVASFDTLIEGFYSWGHSRYKIQFQRSERGVVRRSVGRPDVYRGDNPTGGFVAYCSKEMVFENNIIVDGDQNQFWTWYKNLAAAFGNPATGCSNLPENIQVYRSISLNTNLGLIDTDASDNPDPNIWEDLIGWDIELPLYYGKSAGGRFEKFPTSIHRAVGATQSNRLTIGDVDTYGGKPGRFLYSRSEPSTVDNSIIYRLGWDGTQLHDRGGFLASTGSSTFDLDSNNIFGYLGFETNGNAQITRTITTDPRANGLNYLPRLDADSPLRHQAFDNGRVGAEVMTFMGSSGTFYNDADAKKETGIQMWPFPHEDLIKEKFAEYSYTGGTAGPTFESGPVETLHGDRGFAGAGTGLYGGAITLTSYIWEYLGNICPEDICLYGEGTVSPPPPPVDTTAPEMSNGLPSGTQPSDTISLSLQVTTNEAASCHYSDVPGQLFVSMTPFSTTGATFHSSIISGLSDGSSYDYYVKCKDVSGNSNASDYSIAFDIASDGGGGDITAPVISHPLPSGVQASGTSQVNLQVTTDEAAACQYSASPSQTYASMTAFSSTGGLSHSLLLSPLVDGQSYSYFVKCEDSAGNSNSDLEEVSIAFSIALPGDGDGDGDGPYELDSYTNASGFSALTSIPQLSGITYNWDADEYITVHQDSYCRLDANFNQLECASLGCPAGDCEDVSYLGVSGTDYEYAFVEEGGAETSVIIVKIPVNDHRIRIDKRPHQTLTFATTNGGDGGEGVAYNPATNTFYACVEDPDKVVYQFQRPVDFADKSFANGTLSVSTALSTAQLDAVLGTGTDLSSCYFNQRSNDLWLLQDIGQRIAVVSLDGALVDLLDLADAVKPEGLTFNAGFTTMVVVSEPNTYETFTHDGSVTTSADPGGF